MNSTETPEPRKKGWCYPTAAARKAHYFVNGEALCKGYFIWKSSESHLEDNNHDSPDNCKTCNRKREKLE